MGSPAEQDLLLWIIVLKIVGRDLDVQSFFYIAEIFSRQSILIVFLVAENENLPAVFRQISATNTIATAGIGAAAAVLLMIPPIVVFIFSQSRMLETMAYSGMKG